MIENLKTEPKQTKLGSIKRVKSWQTILKNTLRPWTLWHERLLKALTFFPFLLKAYLPNYLAEFNQIYINYKHIFSTSLFFILSICTFN